MNREILTCDRTYYFRCQDGDNGNDGLTNTPEGACRTPQELFDRIAGELDLNGYTVTIQSGQAGVITRPNDNGPPVDVHRFPVGGGNIVLQGDTGNWSAHILRSNIAGEACVRTRNVNGAPNIHIAGFQIESAGHGIQFGHAGWGLWGYINFMAMPGRRHLLTDQKLTIVNSVGPWAIKGGAETHIYADYGTIYPAHECTFWTNVQFDQFIRSGFGGQIDIKHMSFAYRPGIMEPTGLRFRAEGGSNILAEGCALNFLPGTSPGVTPTGGRYCN